MDLLLISNQSKSHYVYIKDFDRFMFNKAKNKNKTFFCRCRLQCFSSEEVLIKHKKDGLTINGKQSIRLKSGSIGFKNHFKQLPVPFKIYADFECILKKVECDSVKNNNSYTRKYRDHVPCGFAYKVVCITINLVKKLFFTEQKTLFTNLLK